MISKKQPVNIEILLHNIHIKCLEPEVPGSFTKIGTTITRVYSLTTYQAAALMCVVRSATIRSRGRARWAPMFFGIMAIFCYDSILEQDITLFSHDPNIRGSKLLVQPHV